MAHQRVRIDTEQAGRGYLSPSNLSPVGSDSGFDIEYTDYLKRERGDVPGWVFTPWFKCLVVVAVVVSGFTPIYLKVERNTADLESRRSHFRGYIEVNPTIHGDDEETSPWNHYCHASFPGAVDEVNYVEPHGYTFVMSQIITRHGDRAPCHILPSEGNVTWSCSAVGDIPAEGATSIVQFSISRERDDVLPHFPPLWEGTCGPGDLTPQGAKQLYMLGLVLGAIYGKFIEISPRIITVRSTAEPRALASAEELIRGLMSEAIVGGVIDINTGVMTDLDIMRPQYSKCPALSHARDNMQRSRAWHEHMTSSKDLMQSLMRITGTQRVKGFPDAHAWSQSFDHYFDNLRARDCHGFSMPCSATDPKACVTKAMTRDLFIAGSWEFVWLSGAEHWPEVPRLSVGALLGKILQNMQLHLSEPSPSGSGPKDETDEMDDHSKQLHIFSGHDDTIGGILAALQVKDWGWPPYASNILIELWKGENGYAVRASKSKGYAKEEGCAMAAQGHPVKLRWLSPFGKCMFARRGKERHNGCIMADELLFALCEYKVDTDQDFDHRKVQLLPAILNGFHEHLLLIHVPHDTLGLLQERQLVANFEGE